MKLKSLQNWAILFTITSFIMTSYLLRMAITSITYVVLADKDGYEITGKQITAVILSCVGSGKFITINQPR